MTWLPSPEVLADATAYYEQVQAAEYPMVWRWHCRLPERFGQRCRVLCRGRMNSCAVEFEDGFTVITSRWAVKRAS